MARAVPLGHHFEGLGPIPPVPEHTRWFEAGPVLVGIEHRALNEEVLGDTFTGERQATLDAAVTEAHGDAAVDDEGVSFHISDAATGVEYVRLDCFAGDPHYHYIQGGTYSLTIAYDEDANGDMVRWALERIRTRLPHMLAAADAPHLVAAFDQAAVDQVMPLLEGLALEVQASVGSGGPR